MNPRHLSLALRKLGEAILHFADAFADVEASAIQAPPSPTVPALPTATSTPITAIPGNRPTRPPVAKSPTITTPPVATPADADRITTRQLASILGVSRSMAHSLILKHFGHSDRTSKTRLLTRRQVAEIVAARPDKAKAKQNADEDADEEEEETPAPARTSDGPALADDGELRQKARAWLAKNKITEDDPVRTFNVLELTKLLSVQPKVFRGWCIAVGAREQTNHLASGGIGSPMYRLTGRQLARMARLLAEHRQPREGDSKRKREEDRERQEMRKEDEDFEELVGHILPAGAKPMEVAGKASEDEPTDAPPGSLEKMLAMRVRACKGFPIFHPRDAGHGDVD